MDDLVVLDVVGSEPTAQVVCAILRDAGIQCMSRATNVGAGSMDGWAVGGPHEIVVRADELAHAREVMREQEQQDV